MLSPDPSLKDNGNVNGKTHEKTDDINDKEVKKKKINFVRMQLVQNTLDVFIYFYF